MSFLPLAGSRRPDEHEGMHPYAIEGQVRERQEELLRLARADHGVRDARRAAGVRPWRQRAGRALLAAAVAVAVPGPRRRTVRRQATTALGFDPPC
jgi:hypothetical protein